MRPSAVAFSLLLSCFCGTLPLAPLAAQAASRPDEAQDAARRALRDYLARARRGENPLSHVRIDVSRILQSAARAAPSDDFIAGQLVAFLVKSEDLSGARAAADACGASPWWCAALRGFVLHLSARQLAADSAFAEAMTAAPPDVRERWSNVAFLLDREARGFYERLGAPERVEMERRIWWLADPLYSLPGNDRLGEHYARWVGLVLFEQLVRAGLSLTCGERYGEAFIRRGWPEQNDRCFAWWGTAFPSHELAQGGGVPAIPSSGVLLAPEVAHSNDWRFSERATGESYLPRYARLRDLPEQTNLFQRGDSLLVVAVTQWTGPRTGTDLRPSLLLASSERQHPVRVAGTAIGARFVFEALVQRNDFLVASLEVLGDSIAGRARLAVKPPGSREPGGALSDLLLFGPGTDLVEDLESILPLALGTNEVPRGQDVGVYVEGYGLAEEQMTASITVTPEGDAPRTSNGEGLRVGAVREGFTLNWLESPAGPGVWKRAVRVGLSDLKPGRYVLELAMLTSGGSRLAARRSIIVLP